MFYRRRKKGRSKGADERNSWKQTCELLRTHCPKWRSTRRKSRFVCTRIPDLYVTTGPYRRYERETWPTSSREMFHGFPTPCQHREWLPVFRSANDVASGPLVLNPPLLRRISSLINAISAIFSAVIVGTFPWQAEPTAPTRLSYHCSSILRISDYSTENNKNSSPQTFRKFTERRV